MSVKKKQTTSLKPLSIHDWKPWQITALRIALYIFFFWATLMLYCYIYEPTQTKEIFKPRVTWEGQEVG